MDMESAARRYAVCSGERDYMARTAKDFPPWQTVYGAFRSLRALGILESLCQRLCRVARYAAGVPVEPTIALLDSQTIKTTEPAVLKVITDTSISPDIKNKWQPTKEAAIAYRSSSRER